MKIYCMSDIHGCLVEFEEALSVVIDQLDKPDTMLCLLGDYVHGGTDSYGVLDKIMNLQHHYGSDKVVALMGNGADDKYLHWMENLPRYYTYGKTIFVHAGIDEDAGDLWEWGTGEDMFISKYPVETGKIEGLDMKVVAGHVGTAEIAGNPWFHDIFYDGESHYFIDGTVLQSGRIPVLMVDTETDKYYQVTESGNWLILPYEEEE